MKKIINSTIQLLLVSILFCAATAVFGQGALGSISGTITDTNGGVVAGATVEVTNNNTGEKRTAVTSGTGTFTVPDLLVGTYTVKVTAAGFAAATTKEVKVSVANDTPLKITVNPSGANEVVTVTGTDVQTQVDTTDHQMSTLLDNKQILDLPLLSRDPSNLVLLAPGAVRSTSGLGGFSINGSRERNNNFLVDGVDNNDVDVPGIPGGVSSPNIDATQEFRVITGNGNAEYGRNTGGIIAVSTKSGTNDFHGNAYIYYRSQDFAARGHFDPAGQIDPLQRKQFGASLGGPIKKDKLFFFFNYEGDRFLQGFQDFRSVPSVDARNGIFHVTDGQGVVHTFDVTPTGANTLVTSPGFFGPGATFDPVSQALLKLIPLPNTNLNATSPSNIGTFQFSNAQVSNVNTYTSRIDYHITDKEVLSGSYNISPGNFNTLVGTFPAFNDGIRSPQQGQLLAINLVSTISPNFINEARFGFNREVANFGGAGSFGVPTTLPDAINTIFKANGIPLAANFGGVNGQMINLGGMGISGLAGFDTQDRTTGTTTFADAITWVRGNHSWKIGGEFRLIRSDSDTNFGRSESLSYAIPAIFGVAAINIGPNFLDAHNHALSNGQFLSTAEGQALNDFTSFLYGGIADQAQSEFFNKSGARVDNNFRQFRSKEIDVFFQDNFKFRNNLTFDYGLRWEYNGVPYEVNGLLSNLVGQDPSGPQPAGGFVFQLVGKNSGTSNLLYKNDYHNFAPRFGFSYSPAFTSGILNKFFGGPTKSAIRGGYGIYYDRIFGNLFGNARGNPPFEEDFFSFIGDTLADTPRPVTLISSPVVDPHAEITPILFPLPGNNPFTNSFNMPYEQKWSIGLQREIGNNLLIEANYVGNKGTNELRVVDGQLTSVARVNAINGTHIPISTISATQNVLNGRLNDSFFQTDLILADGFSTYNSMQIKVTKRLSDSSKFGSGQFQFSYTLAHAIDNSADALVTQTGERSFPRDSSGFAGGLNAERGNSGFIPRHNLSVNFTYNVPLKFSNQRMDRAFGNWELSSIMFIRSGLPFSVFSSIDAAGTGLSQRADFGNGSDNLTNPTGADPTLQTGPLASLFAQPCPVGDTQVPGGCTGSSSIPRQGNVGRNSFFGPGFSEVDFSIIKRIPITERIKLRVQADFFNLFNSTNFDNPVNIITSPQFGQSVNIVGIPRTIQFAARIDF
ncbi:MAG TPA: TonB-dependent receptor [Blastocatellia bacterium]|nr:TonB-dependent receptor [Blastocatellia bacterium]